MGQQAVLSTKQRERCVTELASPLALHSPSRQEQLVDLKISDLSLAGVKNTPASHKMAQTPGLICETFQGWWLGGGAKNRLELFGEGIFKSIKTLYGELSRPEMTL